MAIYSIEKNVFDESLDRIRLAFDTHDEVIVAMSGGKDSTVLFELTLMVAKEKGRLPLKVFWLDQEAEWQGTVDYMYELARRPEVKPYIFQFPFTFNNNLNYKEQYITVWDEAKKDVWLHERFEQAITVNPDPKHKVFQDLVNSLPHFCKDKPENSMCSLGGVRIQESLMRRTALLEKSAQFMGETWFYKEQFGVRRASPIYDWDYEDIWTAIAKYRWQYNKVYDMLYRLGTPKKNMRISALIHETSYHHIAQLHEIEPATYNKFIRRVNGTNAVMHWFDYGRKLTDIDLPYMFKNWTEYRDYLLVSLIKTEPEREHFRKMWKPFDLSESNLKVMVQQVIMNDYDGTFAKNKMGRNSVKKKYDRYDQEYNEDYQAWLKNQEQSDQ